MGSTLQLLSHRSSVATLSLFYRYFHGKCSDGFSNLVPPVWVFGRKTQFAISAHPCTIADLRCRMKGSADSFIPRAVSLWNSLPVTCFPLLYDLPSFKRIVNSYFWHLWGYIKFHLISASSCVLVVFMLFFSFILFCFILIFIQPFLSPLPRVDLCLVWGHFHKKR